MSRSEPDGAHRAYLATRHLPGLDGLRCLAILPVIWHHSASSHAAGVLGRGHLGVHLFFAVSGFLITTLLLRERDATGTITLSRFYARRSLRIFPLYYAVLALYVVYAWALPSAAPERTHFFESLPWYASYTTNWFVDFDVAHPVIFMFSWSLATEEQFYLVWPAVIRRSAGLGLGLAFMVAALGLDLGAELGWLEAVLSPSGLGHRMLTSISAPICLGALLALGLHSPRGHAVISKALGHKASAPLALAALVALVSVDVAPALALHLGMVALVGAVSLRADHGLAWLLEAAPVRWVGTVSYGMYLLHVSAIRVAKEALPPALETAVTVFLVATPLTMALAAVSHRTFERRFLALRDRFRDAEGTRDGGAREVAPATARARAG